MSTEGRRVVRARDGDNLEGPMEMMNWSQVVDKGCDDVGDGKENGSLGVVQSCGLGDTHDELVQMATELKLQNEYLRCHFDGMRGSLLQKEDGSEAQGAEHLKNQIESLRRELLEERQTRGAAENALKHLQAANSEAEARCHQLEAKLAEAQEKMDKEIKEREDKYSDLDTKLGRLHKRAKQRIQELQKEKDDLEVCFNEVKATSEQATAQQLVLQHELERTRQQANEALKAINAERQQLRSTCNKLRDDNEELRRSLHPKELAIESLQQTILDKDQMLEDLRGLIKVAEDKRQASIAEITAKYQKNIENLESQLAEVVSERSKAVETMSSLQVSVAEKESKIAEIEAASTGEAARLRAAAESLKGDVAVLKHEHEKEKESWDASYQTLKEKLEKVESNCIRAEVEAAKLRSQLEVEVSTQAQILSSRDTQLEAAKEEIKRLQGEFAAYKARAHALLQKKDSELAAAKDSEQIKALEEALKELEKDASLASAGRDLAIRDLQNAKVNFEKELAERDEVLHKVKQQLQSMESTLKTVHEAHQKEKQAWELDLHNLEETWRIRCDTLQAESDAASGQHLKQELDKLNIRYEKLKEEHNSYRDLADRMIEEKDREISRLLDDNKILQQSMDSRPPVNESYSIALPRQDISTPGTTVAEQQILLLARQQAQREEELAQSHRHILALQEEIEDLERENRLHSQQEAMLKAELRNIERSQKREGVDMTYLKNVILKLLETGEVEALLPVVAMLLQFSPEETLKCQQTYRTHSDVPPSPGSDKSGTPLSLFSRFSFS
ncbi:hypothetical protein MLD38_005162 [Melastoma candidum]|uniref:Uncharacterized protein n=1 Tax=Melastoma candidum TaxID=119954 RepID=A0ACB9SB96_9MYRT|nr:hypothetical protein MLD38_005162 [Melastoma candidum]